MTCELVDPELDAYVDSELDAQAASVVRQHLDGCPACRRRVVERQALGRLVRAAEYYPAPDRLRARVAGRSQRTALGRRIVPLAAAAALVLSVAGAVSLVRSATTRAGAAVDEVVNSHVRSLMADHLFDVQSSDQHTVKPWFLGKIDVAPPVADLSPIGFPLVGGRLDYLGGRSVAALVYQRQKHTINVFISPDASPGRGAIDAYSVRGFHVRRWTRDGMSFWAVSDLNDAELNAFVRALGAT